MGLLGILMLIGMLCLCQKGTCKSSRKYERSKSMRSALSQDTKIIIGTLQQEQRSRLSRNSSLRSSIKSSVCNTFDDDLVMYFGDGEEDDKDYNAEEILVRGKQKLFTVSEEIDPTEDGLESLEWENNDKSGRNQIPWQKKTHIQNADSIHINNDFPSFLYVN